MKHPVRILPLMALLGAAPAAADPVLECSTRAGSQIEIGTCLENQEKAVDAAYGLALQFATDAARELDEVTRRKAAGPALDAGQAAWTAYRGAHCEYVGATYGGGSGTGLAIRGCRIELARERIRTLMQFAE